MVPPGEVTLARQEVLGGALLSLEDGKEVEAEHAEDAEEEEAEACTTPATPEELVEAVGEESARVISSLPKEKLQQLQSALGSLLRGRD